MSVTSHSTLSNKNQRVPDAGSSLGSRSASACWPAVQGKVRTGFSDPCSTYSTKRLCYTGTKPFVKSLTKSPQYVKSFPSHPNTLETRRNTATRRIPTAPRHRKRSDAQTPSGKRVRPYPLPSRPDALILHHVLDSSSMPLASRSPPRLH